MIPLNDIPDDAQLNKIDASAAHHGRPCLRLALDASSRAGKFRVDFVDKPSFLLLPHVMQDGVIEVDLCARLLPDAPDYARSFIGLAYRVQDDLSTYESLYLRPTNGHPHAPPPPRDVRAVQYYTYPDHPFDVLRETDPGRFEAGADIALNRWTQFRSTLHGADFTAYADGKLILQGMEKLPPAPAALGCGLTSAPKVFLPTCRFEAASNCLICILCPRVRRPRKALTRC
jgi:hypothetical protein